MEEQQVIFQIDKRTVTEGDVVEISWQCPNSQSVLLTLDNGYKKTEITLEPSGSKRFRLNRSKGRTHLTLQVKTLEKTFSKKLSVKVKKMPTVKAETVDHNGRTMGKLKIWWQKTMTKCHDFTSKIKMSVQSLPEAKQLAVKLLTAVGILLMLCAIWPAIYNFILTALVIYLLFILLRK